MCGPLLLALIAIPTLEIWIFIEVGARIGALPTILLIFLTAAAGLAAAREQSLATVDKLRRGQLPAEASALQGPLLLLAALCLLIPGFATDLIGALLLLPPIRAAAARALIRRYGRPRPPDDPDHPSGLGGPDGTIIVVRRRDP
ncbi:MAG: FxsA family protein [Myxococcales bacterium]|nr:FxsA family protein [Myxococcales bacterium]